MQTIIRQIMMRTTGEVRRALCYKCGSPSNSLSSAAIACEVIARRVVHRAPPERLTSIMSLRFRYRQRDGDESDMTSALELAIDTERYCAPGHVVLYSDL